MKAERDHSQGFTMLELLIVVVIAVLIMAIAIPNLIGFYRFRKIRGAAREVTEEIERARYGAISRNVNFGVVFVTLDQTRYQVVTEDDLQRGTAPDWSVARLDWAALTGLGAVQARPMMTLPAGVIFDPNCVSHTPVGGGAPNAIGFRFNRMGRYCAFDAANCGPAPPGAPGMVNVVTDTGGATVCLQEVTTRLTSWVTVSQGGRVRSRQDFE